MAGALGAVGVYAQPQPVAAEPQRVAAVAGSRAAKTVVIDERTAKLKLVQVVFR